MERVFELAQKTLFISCILLENKRRTKESVRILEFVACLQASIVKRSGIEVYVDYADDSDVEEFDKSFPPKEKLKLPGQIFG